MKHLIDRLAEAKDLPDEDLLAPCGCFMLSGGVGNDHIALPLEPAAPAAVDLAA